MHAHKSTCIQSNASVPHVVLWDIQLACMCVQFVLDESITNMCKQHRQASHYSTPLQYADKGQKSPCSITSD